MSCIYKFTFPNNGVYIGRTDMKPEDRWENGWGYRNTPGVFVAIVKYGWDNITKEILYEGVSHDESVILEKELIEKAWNTHEIVYNMKPIYAQKAAQKAQSDVAHMSTVNTTNVEHKRGHYKKHIVPVVEKPDWMVSCPIDVYTKDGVYITTYPSVKITAEELGLNQGNITSCCRGVRATGKPQFTVNGYIFRYAPTKMKEFV